jgi:hypothetical protein
MENYYKAKDIFYWTAFAMVITFVPIIIVRMAVDSKHTARASVYALTYEKPVQSPKRLLLIPEGVP